MIAQGMLCIHVVLCGYIVWSVFARARWLDDRALPSVRAVFWLLAASALLGLAWPIARQWAPDVWSISMLASICLVQRTTAAKWREGVPEYFLQPPRCRPEPERTTSNEVMT